MNSPVTSDSGVRDLLADSCSRHHVPGAVLAVWDGYDLWQGAWGVVNAVTGVDTTTDALFQIGSITKTYTATLVAKLATEGSVALDAPVLRYLPGAVFGDRVASESITVRQVLTHTAGLEGDHIVDCGRGGDALERYLDACRTLGQLHDPGEQFSYCNAGYAILGRLIEVATGKVWDCALAELLLEPLNLSATFTLPEDAIMHRVAVGHSIDDESKTPVRASPWRIPRSMGPAGAISATAEDVVRFARALMGGQLQVDTDRMLEPAVALPPHLGAGLVAWSAGWMIFDWSGVRVVGHDGGTIGQYAFLRVLPDENVVAVLLTNASIGSHVADDVFRLLLAPWGAIPPENTKALDGDRGDLMPFTGCYRRLGVDVSVREENGRLVASEKASGPLAEFWTDSGSVPLERVDEQTFRVAGSTYVFTDMDGNRPRWMYTNLRAHKRLSDDALGEG